MFYNLKSVLTTDAAALMGWDEDTLREENGRVCLCGGAEYGNPCACHGCKARALCMMTGPMCEEGLNPPCTAAN